MSVEKTISTDVVVIGAGMMGAAITYYLAKEGLSVILVEKGNICSGATGRQGGMVTQIDGRDDNVGLQKLLLGYTKANNRIFDLLQEELQFDFEYRRRGGLDIAMTDEENELLKKLHKLQVENGDDEIFYLDKHQLKDLCPTITPVAKGARFRPTDANINTFMLVYALISGAKAYGAKVYTDTPVEHIIHNDQNEAVGVQTAAGVINSKWVVNACGAWAEGLTEELNIAPVCSTGAITEPIPPVHIQTFETEIDKKIVFGGTLTSRGNLLFGAALPKPRKREEHYNNDLSLLETRNTASVIAKVFPRLKNVNVIRMWGGTMGWSQDGLPYVGPVKNKPGLVVAAAFPIGGSLGLILSKLAAQCIYQGKPDMPLDLFRIDRFTKKIDWPEEYDYTSLFEFVQSQAARC